MRYPRPPNFPPAFRVVRTTSRTVMSAEVYPPSLPALLSFLCVANEPPPARTRQRTPQPMRGPHAGKTPSRFYQRNGPVAPLSDRLFRLALQAFPRLRTDHDL